MDFWKLEEDGSRTLIQVPLNKEVDKKVESVEDEEIEMFMHSFDKLLDVFVSLDSAYEDLHELKSNDFDGFESELKGEAFHRYIYEKLDDALLFIEGMQGNVPWNYDHLDEEF